MEQHLTVREAKAFTSKSESTIKRLIREIVADPQHADRGLILPSPEEVERRKAAGDTFVWKLNRDLLIRRFPQDQGSEEGIGGARRAGEAANSETPDLRPIIEVLREQLQSKDRQLQTLETQLDRKDDQIKNLNERMHESNVLMGELQRRLVIAAPVANKNDSINAESVNAEDNESPVTLETTPKQSAKSPLKTENTPASKLGRKASNSPQRRSFFGSLFQRRS